MTRDPRATPAAALDAALAQASKAKAKAADAAKRADEAARAAECGTWEQIHALAARAWVLAARAEAAQREFDAAIQAALTAADRYFDQPE